MYVPPLRLQHPAQPIVCGPHNTQRSNKRRSKSKSKHKDDRTAVSVSATNQSLPAARSARASRKAADDTDSLFSKSAIINKGQLVLCVCRMFWR